MLRFFWAGFIALSLLWQMSGWSDEWENDLQLWTPVVFQGPIHGKVLGFLEVNPRVGNNVTDMNQLILRPGIGYQVKPNWSVMQGYGWITNYQPTFREEHRIWQQSALTHTLGQWSIVNRTRLEERFIEGTNGAAVRARHQLRLSRPVKPGSKWYVVGFEEFFVNLNSLKGGPRAGFDQNRIFAGLGRQLGTEVRLEGGYQLQLIGRDDPQVDQINHVILVTLFWNF